MQRDLIITILKYRAAMKILRPHAGTKWWWHRGISEPNRRLLWKMDWYFRWWRNNKFYTYARQRAYYVLYEKIWLFNTYSPSKAGNH